jgi:hypothetical protein
MLELVEELRWYPILDQPTLVAHHNICGDKNAMLNTWPSLTSKFMNSAKNEKVGDLICYIVNMFMYNKQIPYLLELHSHFRVPCNQQISLAFSWMSKEMHLS